MTEQDAAVVDWLLEGDPAIRWQVMRDLLDEPPAVWEEERRRTLEHGWVAELLARQGCERRVAGRSLDGLDLDAAPARRPRRARTSPSGPARARRARRPVHPSGARRSTATSLLKRVDLCHLGFWLGLSAYFLDPDDPRLLPLAEAILSAQFADGGWNCHMRNHPHRTHSSFHTTFNVLENVRVAVDQGAVPAAAFRDAEARAAEFMLAHRLYRSDHTGEVISERFTQLTYPWHWHYTFLRGLDYLRLTPAIEDERAGRCDRAAAERAQAERALAAAEADSRHAARRDGEAGPGEPLEHAARASRSPRARRMNAPAAVVAAVTAATRARPVSWRHVVAGHTHAEKWLVELADGRSVFVKAATEPSARPQVERETALLESRGGAVHAVRPRSIDGGRMGRARSRGSEPRSLAAAVRGSRRGVAGVPSGR